MQNSFLTSDLIKKLDLHSLNIIDNKDESNLKRGEGGVYITS